MPERLILASGSAARRSILRAAAVPFEGVIPSFDEQTARMAMSEDDRTPRDIALGLAEGKALAADPAAPDILVLGADQVLEFKGAVFSKPQTKDDARAQLEALAGERHALHSALAITQKAEVIWRHVSTVWMEMRALSVDYLSDYLERNWPDIGESIGGYKLEGEGGRLFQKIDGDYFSVLGLPLLPLVSWLIDRGVLST
ncbi:MAG: Maf family nucleotide pyrophosphatase [Pseudomonadota bacterium]